VFLQQTFSKTAEQFPSTHGCNELLLPLWAKLGHKTSNILYSTRDFTQLHYH